MPLTKNPKADLKLKYPRALEISLILSLVVLILAFKYFPQKGNKHLSIDNPQELINLEEVYNTQQLIKLPPPPKPPVPIEAQIEDILSDDIDFEENDLDVNENVGMHVPKVEEEREENFNIFIAVEEMPSPVGGLAAIQKKIVYPEIALRAGVEGKVLVKAYIDENGNVFNVELIKGIGAGCDEAALKAVSETKFCPGKQRGKPVKVQMTIPVNFVIK